jgi:predicted flavoprotein YhiN
MSTHDDWHDVAVIGAGAAGLAASIFAAEASEKCDHAQRIKTIKFLDAVKNIGYKILILGCGSCNVMHPDVMPADFFGSRHVIKNVLPAVSVE